MSSPSLSVVLPVYNAEQSLARHVSQLLEILPDLAHPFEILVINDGSTDNTEEVAAELAREFPQVRVVRHPLRRGRAGAVETGLAETSTDILFVQDEGAPVDSNKLLRLWELRDHEAVVSPQPELRLKPTLLQRLAAWGVRLEEETQQGGTVGVQMIRRNSLNQFAATQPIQSIQGSRHSRVDRPGVPHESQRTTKPSNLERPRLRSPQS